MIWNNLYTVTQETIPDWWCSSWIALAHRIFIVHLGSARAECRSQRCHCWGVCWLSLSLRTSAPAGFIKGSSSGVSPHSSAVSGPGSGVAHALDLPLFKLAVSLRDVRGRWRTTLARRLEWFLLHLCRNSASGWSQIQPLDGYCSSAKMLFFFFFSYPDSASPRKVCCGVQCITLPNAVGYMNSACKEHYKPVTVHHSCPLEFTCLRVGVMGWRARSLWLIRGPTLCRTSPQHHTHHWDLTGPRTKPLLLL